MTNKTNVNAASESNVIRVDMDEEMQAFDRLPKRLQMLMRYSPDNYSALQIQQYLDTGFTTDILVGQFVRRHPLILDHVTRGVRCASPSKPTTEAGLSGARCRRAAQRR